MEQIFGGAFMPHGHCYLWKPAILWMHVIADAVIVLSYYSIPLILVYLVRKSKGRIPFNVLFLLFAIFILACGTTHLMEIINVWEARYLVSGIVKVITALASIGTALTFIPVLPKLINVISRMNDEPSN